jgi:hypothetical protein
MAGCWWLVCSERKVLLAGAEFMKISKNSRENEQLNGDIDEMIPCN